MWYALQVFQHSFTRCTTLTSWTSWLGPFVISWSVCKRDKQHNLLIHYISLKYVTRKNEDWESWPLYRPRFCVNPCFFKAIFRYDILFSPGSIESLDFWAWYWAAPVPRHWSSKTTCIIVLHKLVLWAVHFYNVHSLYFYQTSLVEGIDCVISKSLTWSNKKTLCLLVLASLRGTVWIFDLLWSSLQTFTSLPINCGAGLIRHTLLIIGHIPIFGIEL